MRKKTEQNNYIIAKGNASLMKDLKYWRQIEYYTLLEQIAIESKPK